MELSLPHDSVTGIVLEEHLSIRAAAALFAYNLQYLRRLLRTDRLEGIKIGQVWLIKLASLEAHLRNGRLSQDQRYGPQRVTADSGKGVAA